MDEVEENRVLEGEVGGGEAVIKRAMGWRRKAVTNYCRLRGGGRYWEMVGKQGRANNGW